ncbi:MAG: uracil-DNA glycosylase family protein, partial [Halieaceae bacterium]|nr:uracil-DNA glycosylase family protein [Halieaceae bacterium]
MNHDSPLHLLARDIRRCRLCEDKLPLGPRPVIQVHRRARVLIVGQAPGRRVHETGRPFNDPSGVRLRGWLGVDEDCFYDPERFALVPMAFCYPGTTKGGDLAPPPECAQNWRRPLLDCLESVQVTILLGRHALAWHLPGVGGSIADIVASWREHAPRVFVAPHPSPRNQRWLRNNPAFERETVPAMRRAVADALR